MPMTLVAFPVACVAFAAICVSCYQVYLWGQARKKKSKVGKPDEPA